MFLDTLVELGLALSRATSLKARSPRSLTISLQIVYTSIVGLVMLAAFLEWILWIGAFMYCLWKVFRKSEHWTVNILAVLIAVGFLLFR